MQVFSKLLELLRVFVSKEELLKTALITTGTPDLVNYDKMADMMHLPKVYAGSQTAKYLDKVNALRQRMGSERRK